MVKNVRQLIPNRPSRRTDLGPPELILRLLRVDTERPVIEATSRTVSSRGGNNDALDIDFVSWFAGICVPCLKPWRYVR